MSDTPLLSPEGFAEAMEALLRAQADIEVFARNGTTLRLRVGESTITVSLDNFYTAYSQQPTQLAAVAETLVQALRNYNSARAITSFDELRERVYPMLKPITLLVQVRERKLPMIVYRPFLADLIIAYVIDEPSSVAYINEHHLERWQIGEHELHAQAMENLRRRTEEHGSYTVTGDGPQRLIIFNTRDGFDATRLLLPALLDRWRTEFPGRMVIGIPNRDFLVIFSDEDEAIFTSVAHQIQRDAAERPYGLTDQLFTLEQGQVREYAWE